MTFRPLAFISEKTLSFAWTVPADSSVRAHRKPKPKAHVVSIGDIFDFAGNGIRIGLGRYALQFVVGHRCRDPTPIGDLDDVIRSIIEVTHVAPIRIYFAMIADVTNDIRNNANNKT